MASARFKEMRGIGMDAAKKRRLKRYFPLYLMVLPGCIYLLINNFLPMAGLLLSFQKVNYRKGLFGGEWVGLDNFKYLFATKDAWVITRNTIVYNVVFIVTGMIIGVAVAIMLNEVRNRAYLKFTQTLILLPHLISWVIVGYLVYAFLSIDGGWLNKSLLPLLGIDSVQWYSEPKYWPFILFITRTWKSFGFSCIIYYSTIVGIDDSYYEAAALDGATRWQQIKFVTLPMLRTTMITLFILNLGGIFRADFGLFYQVPMNQGMLYGVTDVLDTYIYRALMTSGNIGMSTAAGFYQSVVGFIFVFVCNMIVRKIDQESAMF